MILYIFSRLDGVTAVGTVFMYMSETMPYIPLISQTAPSRSTRQQ
jgi:hypothetical protein